MAPIEATSATVDKQEKSRTTKKVPKNKGSRAKTATPNQAAWTSVTDSRPPPYTYKLQNERSTKKVKTSEDSLVSEAAFEPDSISISSQREILF